MLESIERRRLKCSGTLTLHNVGTNDQHVAVEGGYFIRYEGPMPSNIFANPVCPFYFLNGQAGVIPNATTADTTAQWTMIPPGKMANFHIRFPPENPAKNCGYDNVLAAHGAGVTERIGHGILRFEVRVFEDRGAVSAGAFIRQDSDHPDQVLVPINSGKKISVGKDQ